MGCDMGKRQRLPNCVPLVSLKSPPWVSWSHCRAKRLAFDWPRSTAGVRQCFGRLARAARRPPPRRPYEAEREIDQVNPPVKAEPRLVMGILLGFGGSEHSEAGSAGW
jgi:hypothetical protein